MTRSICAGRAWVLGLLPAGTILPRVVAPGFPIGLIASRVARELGLPRTTRILAGTTDSTAAVIAAGAHRPGDAVTSLGSTLVVKILAERPVSASQFGVYSHRFGDHWLVGGASNSGGAVLRQFFSDNEIADLSRAIDPATTSGLNYYPLPAPGERFPRREPDLAPRLQPRPRDPVRFLHGLLEGIAAIEAEGYARLNELGAPRPTRIITVGGGSANPIWTRLRARLLGLDVLPAEHPEAAYGAARLALEGPQGQPPTGNRKLTPARTRFTMAPFAISLPWRSHESPGHRQRRFYWIGPVAAASGTRRRGDRRRQPQRLLRCRPQGGAARADPELQGLSGSAGRYRGWRAV